MISICTFERQVQVDWLLSLAFSFMYRRILTISSANAVIAGAGAAAYCGTKVWLLYFFVKKPFVAKKNSQKSLVI